MKRAVKVAIAAVLLHGSAHAADLTAPPGTALHRGQGKTANARQTPLAGKKAKLAAKNKGTGNKAGSHKAAADSTAKRDDVTETPADTLQQSVQLRGVRG